MTANEMLAEIDGLRMQIESNMIEHRQLVQKRDEANRHELHGAALAYQNEMDLLVTQRTACVDRIFALRQRMKEFGGTPCGKGL